MVEANNQPVPFDTRVQYASFRSDKQPAEGHSAELISNLVEAKYYDDLQGQYNNLEHRTLYQLYRRNVDALGAQPFLGTRQQLADVDGKPCFGEYQW